MEHYIEIFTASKNLDALDAIITYLFSIRNNNEVEYIFHEDDIDIYITMALRNYFDILMEYDTEPKH